MQFKSASLWRRLGLINFVWCLGILGFGQAFFIVRLFLRLHFGQPVASMNLYLDLGIALIAGALWALAMWYALVNRHGNGNGTARDMP